jgi:hypothetical protein
MSAVTARRPATDGDPRKFLAPVIPGMHFHDLRHTQTVDQRLVIGLPKRWENTVNTDGLTAPAAEECSGSACEL